MLQNIKSEIDSIEYQFVKFDKLSRDSDIDIHTVLSNHMVLRVAGLVENSLQAMFDEYCRRYSNIQISHFVSKTIRRENSLNTEKIKNIIEKLDSEIWLSVSELLESVQTEALDSIKAIRDQIAHGKSNGTGLRTVRGYFDEIKKLLKILCDKIVPLI